MKSIKTVTTYSCIKFNIFRAQQTTKGGKSSRHEYCAKASKMLKVEN